MSSMAEGNEGWSREDELDLGQEDDQQPDQEAPDHSVPSPHEPTEEALDTIEHADDHDSDRTVEPTQSFLPETPPPRYADWAATGSIDGTGSNPDDSPSLHVSGSIGAQPEPLSDRDRAPFHLH